MGSEIKISRMQVKSLKKAKRLAYALNIIEEECGIKKVKIIFEDMFICPWINLEKLNNTKMEELIRDIFNNTKK